MKRFWKLIVLLLIIVSCVRVNASIDTYVRTRDNLRVSDDVEVRNDNLNDILNTPSVNAKEKIYDFADILTKSEETNLYERIKEYTSLTKYDIAILTTNDLNGYSIADYTYNFYDYNLFKKEGVIFTIYMNNGVPEIYMGTCGDGSSEIFSIYSDRRINETLKYVYENNLRKKEYYKACDNFVKLMIAFYNVDTKDRYRVDPSGNVIKTVPWFELIILSLTLTFVIIMIMLYTLGVFKRKSNGDVLEALVDKSTMTIKLNEETYLETTSGTKRK